LNEQSLPKSWQGWHERRNCSILSPARGRWARQLLPIRSEAVENPSWWGRLVENAVGAHLQNSLAGRPCTLYYWRQRHLEVDFVLETPRATWAIEVKSGRTHPMKGLTKFCALYPEVKPLVIGSGGMELEDFFSCRPVIDW